MPDFATQPGLLYVLATLLPAASFTILLLWGALRWALRSYAKENASVNGIFQAIGGAVPGRAPAYVATAAIFLSFCCAAVGFSLFLADASKMHHLEHELQHALAHHAEAHDDHEPGKAEAKKKDHAKEKHRKPNDIAAELRQYQIRWEHSWQWARINTKQISDLDRGTILTLGFRIDMLAAVMFTMVTFIATLIHLFSIGYMADELKSEVEDHEVHTDHGHFHRRGRFGRFFMYLSLFCFSMLNLLLADNLFQIFVSWELVGICSFLLIGFYFERTSASNASNKAFITNRVGDAGFIIGMLIIWTYFGTFNFEQIFAMVRCPHHDSHGEEIVHEGKKLGATLVRADLGSVMDDEIAGKWQGYTLLPNGDHVLIMPRVPGHFHGPQESVRAFVHPKRNQIGAIPYWLLTLAGLGIFLGCVGKSAQFPLQVWLPDAMEGPTPVSALIHAATMVAAGVYLVGRCYSLFTPDVLLTIAYVGAITLFVAATIAVVMTDIKKVLAYSTVSQLGYMMLALGVGAWTAGLLHLLTHAFFKALLFLGSGSVIYGCHHQQDMGKMGGLFPKMKITALTMLMGVLAIAGTPFFSGWYSKDEILAGAFGYFIVNKQHFLLFLLPLVTAGITTFYMFRMWFMTFTGKPKDDHVHEHAHESPWVMTVPLILLAILSVCVAWGWPLHKPQNSWLGHQLHHYSQPRTVTDAKLLDDHGDPIPLDADLTAENKAAIQHHSVVGMLALAVVIIGLSFALALYYFGALDPNEAKEQFPGVHRFLLNKWYFDELYSVAIVRPGLVIAHWCRNFDMYCIDAFVNLVGKWNLVASYWSGRFDKGIVDGLVNLVADVSFTTGNWLRNVQTGYLRSYILFLALAAMAVWIMLYAWAGTLFGG